MQPDPKMEKVYAYFDHTLKTHGATAQGADWNSAQAQEIRFDQLLKIVKEQSDFSLLDYGCGYGALADYMLRKGLLFDRFYGYDILPAMIEKASQLHNQFTNQIYTADFSTVPQVDYAVASGVFNIRLDATTEEWTQYALDCMKDLYLRVENGFSVNFLTGYSDADRMAARPDLFFADPLFMFDYCKRHFSRNVALLHDYEIYDFTILVRKTP